MVDFRLPFFLVALLASGVVGEGDVTVNGCGCKKEWTDNDGHECKEHCCPLHGHEGKWCMVEDTYCEDATWGMCKLQTASGSPTSTGLCADQDGWHDLDGDNCKYYAENLWCTAEQEQGMGWHTEWGSLMDFAANGYSGLTACCACGGGKKGMQAIGGLANINAETRFTYSGCQCKTTWEENGLKSSSSCSQPDGDPLAWCMVVDANCEDAVWGYCRPLDARNEFNPASTSIRHGHCTDDKDFKDVDGDGCAGYASKAYCTDVGGYGLGWNLEWGTFAEFALPGGKTPWEACCACGGGTQDAGYTQHQGHGTEVSAVDNKVRTTLTKCECKKSWDMADVGKCDSYCCNVDNDPVGEWCMVKDQNCEDADWGYCATDGLGIHLPSARTRDHAHCFDGFIWKDKDGDDCQAYNQNQWCANGKEGPGWHEEWGDVPAEAFKMCCSCGGGGVRGPPGQNVGGSMSNQVVEAAKELVSEEPDRMFFIANGPCRMDSEGCVHSGNYSGTGNYGALEQCEIGVVNENAKPIHVVFFETEYKYDVLKVNGQLYSGTRAPNGIVPSQTIFWGTDGQDQKQGWKLCARGEVREHSFAVKLLKFLGITVAVVMSCCCLAFIGLWIHTHRKMAHGDGLGAGPTKIGKYSVQEEA